MEQQINYCQVVLQKLNEFINQLVDTIRNISNQIIAWFAWPEPARLEIIFLNGAASAHKSTRPKRKSSKKCNGRSNSLDIGLSSDIDHNIHKHIEKVDEPEQQIQILAPPPAELRQDELKDDTALLHKAAVITEGKMNLVQEKTAEKELIANKLDAEVSIIKPAVINTPPAIMQHQEPPMPIIQQNANYLEIKPLSLPNSKVLAENKKPLPGQTRKRIIQSGKISNKKNAVQARPRWR